MLDFTQDELTLLIQDGYEPGFMMDIREGDLIAIPPIMRTNIEGLNNTIKTLVVKRVIKSDSSYYDSDKDEIIPHTVINFIGITLDNLPEHCMYGNTYPCFIKRGE